MGYGIPNAASGEPEDEKQWGTRSEVPPGFDPERFDRILFVHLLYFFAPLVIFMVLNIFGVWGGLMERFATDTGSVAIGPISAGGIAVGLISYGGLAVGLLTLGGLGVGFVAVGGGCIGIIAMGGGAIGLVAIGGGAVGVVAVGGGAIGYVAIGGGARGIYVLAGRGAGRYVFDRTRQDPAAVRFFCKYLPGLRRAFSPETGSS